MTAKTIRNIHSILSGAFATAKRWEWIAWNPAESAKPPAVTRRPLPATTPEGTIRAGLAAVGLELPDDAYVFSNDPMGARPWNPDWATHKASDLAAAAGVKLNIKGLRHYADPVPASMTAFMRLPL